MNDQENRDAELEAFRQQQVKLLSEFEEKQRRELDQFEVEERKALEEFERREGRPYEIKIDRTEYKVHERSRTGLQLRALAQPPIGPDRDLFEVVPGGADKKIENNEEVRMQDGLRFFTAPAHINPGAI
jgi:hypothetical protein